MPIERVKSQMRKAFVKLVIWLAHWVMSVVVIPPELPPKGTVSDMV